jgi:hypothetical protein
MYNEVSGEAGRVGINVVNTLTANFARRRGSWQVFNDNIPSFLRDVFCIERPLPITQLVVSHPLATGEFLGNYSLLWTRLGTICLSWKVIDMNSAYHFMLCNGGQPNQRVLLSGFSSNLT